MREVSCKAIEPFLRAADVRNLGRETLLVGVGYTLDHLQDSHERIDYDSFLRFIANIRQHFTDDDIINIGATGLEGPGVRTFLTIGRLIMSPTGFYRWMLAKGGVGNQMFNNLVPVFKELEPGHFNVEVRWAPGYQPCPEFLLMSKGGMQAAARLLGLGKDASVEIRFTDVGGVIEVRVPRRRTFRGWLFSGLGTKRDVRAAGAQLEDANTALERRYVELEKAQAAIEQQRLALDHAYRLGYQIWGELDVETIAGIVARELASLASVIGARVALATPEGRAIVGKSGNCSGQPSVSVNAAGGQAKGTLAVWSSDPDALVAIRSVVELVAPTVSTAIDNALAHDELTTHQRNLESVVAKRTSELTMARDALAGNVEELRAAQVARDIFFANVNHEFRAPLSLISLGLADLQTRIGDGLDEGATRALDSVGGSARRLLRLVDEILMLAMGTEIGPQVKPVPTDVVEAVHQLVRIWQPAIDAHRHTLQVSLPRQLAASVDPVSFEWMVTNLLSNAIKYTPEGGSIEVSVEQESDNLVLCVRDTGIGIDEGLVERLFTRGARGERGSSQRGSGIGLAVVHQLVEAHRGSVRAIPRPEGGTDFRLVLPIGNVDAAQLSLAFVPLLAPDDYDVGLPPVVSGQVFSPARTSLGTILVAEDGARMALRIAEVLGDEYTVVVALNGSDALELASTHQPHLLITDVDMPGMSGIELAARFRDLSGDQLSPVLILSAFGDLASRIEGLNAGALDYMVKPFDGRELKARVRAQFRMRDLSMRLSRAERLATTGTLAAGLAHELRNPTNGVVNAIVPLRELLPPELAFGNAPTAQLLDVVVACAEQISAVCRHLLDFGGARSLGLAPINVTELFARARMLARQAFHGIELRVDEAAVSELPPLRIAGALMAQVLANLFENAAHAAGPGGWVQFRASIRDGRSILEVSDSGPGVAAALRERVFEPFFTTKDPGVGTGLGLSVARDIVHRHHGVLEIREHGGRPCFVIDLPSAATPPSLGQSKNHDDA